MEQQHEIKTQADAVLHFIQKLDIEMLDMVLEPDRIYQKFEKPHFVKLLGDAFNEFIEAGDTYLNRFPGQCNDRECHFKWKGYTFIGNNSGNYFDLIIEIENGVVQDIFECHTFKCYDEKFLRNNLIQIFKFPKMQIEYYDDIPPEE